MHNQVLLCLWLLPTRVAIACIALLGLTLAGCSSLQPPSPIDNTSLYLPSVPPSVNETNTPYFLVKEAEKSFNKIGSPAVISVNNAAPGVGVDVDQPAVYFESQQFTTTKGNYTNLIYRIHFQEVPSTWTSFNLTAGKNPGILFIYTLDQAGTLLLVTTVHTCGCYLAFLPTDSMPHDFLPKSWPTGPQAIFGHTLPSLLQLAQDDQKSRIAFTLESETHRVSAVTLAGNPADLAIPYKVAMQIKPMADLYALPFQNGTTSFFEMTGPRRGYVKDNTKIFERLFMSWWALDLHVGEDKAYSIHDTSEVTFYTSLKFWARKVSDLKNFPAFLDYWGWQL